MKIKKSLDTLFINELTVPCVIGAFDDERTEKQNVVITITLSTDTKNAGQTDRLEDTVSYSTIAKNVYQIVSNSQFYLLEKLAQKVADTCLADKRIKQVKIYIEKPKAIKIAKSTAIEIIRNAE